MFLSTFEKQLDSKRRIVVPAEFRALASGPFDGIVCFPSIEADCIEGGGQKLFESYREVIEEFPLGDPTRGALEFSIFGGMKQLAFDTAGRITLPESYCEQFGLADEVVLVGMGDRFQIWSAAAHRERCAQQRELASKGLAEFRAQQRAVRLGSVG